MEKPTKAAYEGFSFFHVEQVHPVDKQTFASVGEKTVGRVGRWQGNRYQRLRDAMFFGHHLWYL